MGESGTPGDYFRRSDIYYGIEHMFLGQFQHSLDSKHRLTIPARYRDLLEDGSYITMGFDNNLMVMTASAFTLVSQRVNKMSITDPTARLLRRLIFSSGVKIDIDNAGRILLPQFQREAAKLDSEVVIVGVGDYFEIWSPSLWSYQTDKLNDTESNQHRFAAFDISSG